MNHIEQAIKEAGFHPSMAKHPEVLFLDPLFWQALGKARGWVEGKQWYYEDEDEQESIMGGFRCPFWEYQWIEFVRHLASGGTAESFFTDLIK